MRGVVRTWRTGALGMPGPARDALGIIGATAFTANAGFIYHRSHRKTCPVFPSPLDRAREDDLAITLRHDVWLNPVFLDLARERGDQSPLAELAARSIEGPQFDPRPTWNAVRDIGHLFGPADPWALLPLEFFRVISVIERVFITCEDPHVRDDFCRKALHRLNTRPWRDWDEIRGSFRPPAGQRFVGVELHLVEVDFTRCDPTDRSQVTSVELMHRYDPEGAFARAGDQDLWRLLEPAATPAASGHPRP